MLSFLMDFLLSARMGALISDKNLLLTPFFHTFAPYDEIYFTWKWEQRELLLSFHRKRWTDD